MTREQAKELLPIIQAFADGKTLEFLNVSNMWEELEDPLFCKEPKCYRTKPGSKYRPFNSKEECWEEMLKHQPFGWIRNKKTNNLYNLSNIYKDEDKGVTKIATEDFLLTLSDLFDSFVFIDGTPFGVKED